MNHDVPEAPVAFLIFNRPEHTKRSFAAIRAARPKRLFIIADGPRTPEEKRLCEEVRNITEKIDWDCQVERKYSDINLGCDPCSTAGISWVFTKVDRLIFIEDDGLPHPDFFPYCNELLEKYKDDTRIMNISGDNFHQKNLEFSCQESYFFTSIPLMHGFATWRRAWNLYDDTMSKWPEVKKRGLLDSIFVDFATRTHFSYKFDQYYNGALTNWDGKWTFAHIINRSLSISPQVNLVTNIGYGQDATNSKNSEDWKANLPTKPLPFPIVHPQIIMLDPQNEKYAFAHIFGINRQRKQRMLNVVKYYFPKIYTQLRGTFGN